MKIALMQTPWSPRPDYIIEANNIREWRAAIAEIPPNRYRHRCAAVYIGDDSKPFVVQQFHGAKWPETVTSADGFLVVRTGIDGLRLAAEQWDCLTQFPAHVSAYDGFMAGVSDLTRKAVFPALRLVDNDIRD